VIQVVGLSYLLKPKVGYMKEHMIRGRIRLCLDPSHHWKKRIILYFAILFDIGGGDFLMSPF